MVFKIPPKPGHSMIQGFVGQQREEQRYSPLDLEDLWLVDSTDYKGKMIFISMFHSVHVPSWLVSALAVSSVKFTE